MIDGRICDKNKFQEKILLIASYSCTVTNYCESKSYYSLLIRINLFK